MIISYLVVKRKFKAKGFIEFVSMLAMAVPGTVLGIGYIRGFVNGVFGTGFLSGIAGLIYSSRISSCDSNNAGVNYEMDAMACVAIGGVSMNGGDGNDSYYIDANHGNDVIRDTKGDNKIYFTDGLSVEDYEASINAKLGFVLTNKETGEAKAYLIPYGSRIKVLEGQELEAGDELTEGSVNPHDILKIKGVRAVQDYMIQEVQRVYRLQGVDINDKHIEVIVRQMLKKIRIENNGDSDFLPGTLVDILEYEDEVERLEAEGKELPEGKQVMLGITKASLATNSFLSAASFQETTKVLTEAAIKGKIDPLIGLKENVIIGKLIPAGTGMKRYRNVKLNTDAVAEAVTEEIETEEVMADIEEEMELDDISFDEMDDEDME